MTLADTVGFMVITILLLELILGILINSFIATVISLDSAKNHHLSSCDAIALIIGISRASLLSAHLIYFILLMLYPNLCATHCLYLIFKCFSMFLSFCSFWFTTLIYIYYCATIANFRHVLFSKMKVRIPQLMSCLLLACIAVSLICALPSPWIFNGLTLTNSTLDYHSNFSTNNYQIETDFFGPVLYYTLGYSPPFFIFCISAVLLITSLFRHTKRMQRSASDFSTPRLDAHYRAVKSVVGFFLLFAVYFVACLCESMNLLFPVRSCGFVSPVITLWYPFAHSALLIRNYPKLNKATGKICKHIWCCMSRGPPEE